VISSDLGLSQLSLGQFQGGLSLVHPLLPVGLGEAGHRLTSLDLIAFGHQQFRQPPCYLEAQRGLLHGHYLSLGRDNAGSGRLSGRQGSRGWRGRSV